MKILAGGLGALLLALLMNGRTLNAAQSCEGLASLTLPDAKITLAQTVAAGAFTPPGAGGARVVWTRIFAEAVESGFVVAG